MKIPGEPFDERTRSLLDSNDLSAYCGLMGSSRLGEYVERKDVLLVSCGAPLARFKIAPLKPPITSPDAAIAHADRFFAGSGLPYCIEYRAGCEPSDRLEAVLRVATLPEGRRRG